MQHSETTCIDLIWLHFNGIVLEGAKQSSINLDARNRPSSAKSFWDAAILFLVMFPLPESTSHSLLSATSSFALVANFIHLVLVWQVSLKLSSRRYVLGIGALN